ncbi:MAG: HAMP domain-containing histidine kinase [Anaerolineae bacterium]|nr:HAMP domain-containing histidine kinase [Anaerolineae bacterium]
MKLVYKLFLSHIVVVAIALAVLATATALVAPANFFDQMTHMQGGTSGMMGQRMQVIDAELEASFQNSVNNALVIAGAVAIVAALAISWFVSQRIVRPIQKLVLLSQRIADGHYEQRLQADTGDELADLVHSFNRMTESLANTEAMRVRLLGDVTHELKTPLASIKGYMEGLQDGVLPATPETYQVVHREADRLQRLVQDLQQLSRTEAGQAQLDIQALQPHEIVRMVVEHMQPQFGDKNIQLHVNVPESLPLVKADMDRTAQVLTNLLGNALQYTPEEGDVHVRAQCETDTVRIDVSDTGVGLAADDLGKIFQRFYRVDKSRARASGGSGIGLTVAQHLIEAQGGEIRAESTGLGQGSTFSFTLQIA